VGSVWIYAGSFLGALVISLVLVPIVRRLAIKREVLDTPGAHKSHSTPVPYLGGLAMVVAFSLAVVAGAIVKQDLSFSGGLVTFNRGLVLNRGASTLGELFLILGLALGLSMMGLIDDLKGLNPFLRLGIEIAVASAVIAYGIQFTSPLPDGIDAIITMIWIVGITNALNLLDNTDGLAAGVTGIAGVTFFILAYANDQPFTALLALGLSGCTLGFLKSNFHPAKIYMGDAGSLYLGFLLSCIGLKIRVNQDETPQLFIPAIVLGVALLDTTMVVVSRIKRGVSPFEGGKDHISHRLMRLGVSVRRGVTIILFGGATCGLIGVALYNIRGQAGYWVVAAVLTIAGASTVLLTTKRALLTVVADTDRSVA
jgi:UDP-GlcNAc:undecaprenyl-phosphate/decaprenyl-phosphate GlcNAc-1-phosphate transferase